MPEMRLVGSMRTSARERLPLAASQFRQSRKRRGVGFIWGSEWDRVLAGQGADGEGLAGLAVGALVALVLLTGGIVRVEFLEQRGGAVEVVAQAADTDDQLRQSRERQTLAHLYPTRQVHRRQRGQLPAEVGLAQPGVRRADLQDTIEAARPGDDAAIERLRVVGGRQVDRLVHLVIAVEPLQQVAVAIVLDDRVDVLED